MTALSGRTAGMSAMLDRMGAEKAGQMAKNSNLLKDLSAFIGPEREGAQRRLHQVEKLTAKLTQIPQYIAQYAKMAGWSQDEQRAVWCQMIEAIGTGNGGPLTAGLDGGFNPMDSTFAGAGFSPPSALENYGERYNQMAYMTTNLMNPSPEFAQQMVMSSILPIAREMIPNTVATKAFITDTAVTEISKPYFLKRRVKAYQQGLSEEASTLMPAEIMEYDPTLVTPREWKRAIRVDMKYIETMNFDVPADMLSDGGREMQVLIDNRTFGGLSALLPPDGGGHPEAGATTNGYTVNADNTVMMLEKKRNPQIEDLNAANQMLRNRGFNPDLIITSPFELGSLMSQQAVLMAYAYGTREVQETGLVGTLVGDAVAWTPNLYKGATKSSLVIWVVDSDELARVVLGYPISLFPDFHMRRLDFELYARLSIFFRNTNAAVAIYCDNADAGIV